MYIRAACEPCVRVKPLDTSVARGAWRLITRADICDRRWQPKTKAVATVWRCHDRGRQRLLTVAGIDRKSKNDKIKRSIGSEANAKLFRDVDRRRCGVTFADGRRKKRINIQTVHGSSSGYDETGEKPYYLDEYRRRRRCVSAGRRMVFERSFTRFAVRGATLHTTNRRRRRWSRGAGRK